MKELNQALLKCKLWEIDIIKDTLNTFYKRKYATLDNCLKKIIPILGKNGIITYTQIFNTSREVPSEIIDKEGVAKEIIKIEFVSTICITIEHVESGEKRTTELPIINPTDMQKLGSSLTYAQRYGILTMLNLASGDDDDGELGREERATKKVNIQNKVTLERINHVKNIIEHYQETMPEKTKDFLMTNIIHNKNIDITKVNQFIEQLGKEGFKL
jgi:hypothetical protein